MAIQISDADIARADTFLTSMLSERIPDADFSEGGALRDFTVKAVALVFAYLEGERAKVSTAQSLLALSQQPDSEEVADAVDALLSNLLISRKSGRRATMRATLHFSAASTVVIAPTIRFFRTAGAVFTLDSATALSLQPSALTPVYAANNTVVDYVTTVSLRAANVGTAYNLPAGRFLQADQFNPFFTWAENLEAVVDGKDTESSQDMLTRAPTAMAVRNLVNTRSIESTLRDNFPLLERVLTVGYGEPEMRRDLVVESASGLKYHVGGMTDIYVKLPAVPVHEEYPIGADLLQHNEGVNVLTDAGADFLTGPAVVPGDVVRVFAGLVNAPRDFVVSEVLSATALAIDPQNDFKEAATVSYTIGRIGPLYTDKRGGSVTGETSNARPGDTTFSASGHQATISLAAKPHLRVSAVQVTSPNDSYDCSPRNFATTPSTPLTHTQRVLRPYESGSALETLLLTVQPGTPGSPDMRINGPWAVRVTYDTLQGYDEIQAYVTDAYQRTLNSRDLVRGYHPLYLSANLSYKLAYGATADLDEEAAAVAVAAWFNNFDVQQVLDVSGLTDFLRTTYPQIGVLMGPVTLRYTLLLPDRGELLFSTTDVVTLKPWQMFSDAPVSSATLLERDGVALAVLPPRPVNPLDDPAAVVAWNARGAEYAALYKRMGVSDRTIRYVASAENISFTQVL